MDILLENGDLALNCDGTPKTVSDMEQHFQQIALAMKIPRGCFVYNRGMGIGEQTLSERMSDTVEMLLNENFVSSKIYVKINEISEVQEGRKIDFTVITDSSQNDSEVIING